MKRDAGGGAGLNSVLRGAGRRGGFGELRDQRVAVGIVQIPIDVQGRGAVGHRAEVLSTTGAPAAGAGQVAAAVEGQGPLGQRCRRACRAAGDILSGNGRRRSSKLFAAVSVKVTVSVCVLPRESTTWIGVENVAPVAAAASRFAVIVMLAVAEGGSEVSEGTVIAEVGPEAFRTPPTAVHPCTRSPLLVTSCPEELRLKLPSRV